MIGTPIHIKTFDKGALSKLRIEALWGEVACIGTDSNEIRIEVFALKRTLNSLFEWVPMSKADFEVEQFRIRKDEDTLSIQSLLHNSSRFAKLIRFKKISFRVFLPKQFSVEAKTYVGDITLQDLKGTNLVNTRFGRLTARRLVGKTIGTGRGLGSPIRVEDCHGEFRLTTSGGSMKIHRSSGDHEYTSGGGSIDIADFEGKIAVKTAGGKITTDRVSGELKAASRGGSIRINGLSGNAAANTKGGSVWVDVNHIAEYLWLETSGGSLRLTFPESQGMDLSAKGNNVKGLGSFNFKGTKKKRRWEGQVNQGGANVKLKTGGGSVKLFSKPVTKADIKNQTYVAPELKNEVNQIAPISELEYSEPKTESSLNKKKQNQENRWKHKKGNKQARKQHGRNKLFDKLSALPSLSQVLLSLLVISFFVYGVNTVIYFTFEIIRSAAKTVESTAVLSFNLVNAVITFTVTWFYIVVIDKYLSLIWLKYLVLVVISFIVYLLVHGLMIVYVGHLVEPSGFWFYYDYMISINKKAADTVSPFQAILFTSIPAIAACSYFAYWNRGRNLSQKISEQEYELLNMEKLKTKAQLTALEARINPHFLYNSLNSIAGLIHENQDKAEDMTIELSKLFRATTGRSNKSYHSIAEEIDLVRSYLEIEQMRFSDRLKYSLNVNKDLEPIMIPRFLLQPLVENAIKHGISKITENGVIEVDIYTEGDIIHLNIHDNGPDFLESVSGGYGLKSVRDKLQLIYGEQAELEIINKPKKAVHLRIDKSYEL